MTLREFDVYVQSINKANSGEGAMSKQLLLTFGRFGDYLEVNLNNTVVFPLSVPLFLAKKVNLGKDFCTLSQARIITLENIESVILQTLLLSRFNGYVVKRGRYTLNFEKLKLAPLRAFSKLIIHSPEPRKNYSWLAPLQDLIIDQTMDQPSKKKRGIRVNPFDETVQFNPDRPFSAADEYARRLEQEEHERIRQILNEKKRAAKPAKSISDGSTYNTPYDSRGFYKAALDALTPKEKIVEDNADRLAATAFPDTYPVLEERVSEQPPATGTGTVPENSSTESPLRIDKFHYSTWRTD